MAEPIQRYRVERDKPGKWTVQNLTTEIYARGSWRTQEDAYAVAYRHATNWAKFRPVFSSGALGGWST